MPVRTLPFALALLLASPLLLAHEPAAHVPPAGDRIAAAAAEAVGVVDAFSDALKAGRLEDVKALLDPAVQVYEGGHVEDGRDAYFAEHAAADAKFLATAQVTRDARSAEASGDLAWVSTRSTVVRDGKRHASIETLVLRRGDAGWKIVHIHWSSRPLPAE
jgi:ketosteroid isomerase-like protein